MHFVAKFYLCKYNLASNSLPSNTLFNYEVRLYVNLDIYKSSYRALDCIQQSLVVNCLFINLYYHKKYVDITIYIQSERPGTLAVSINGLILMRTQNNTIRNYTILYKLIFLREFFRVQLFQYIALSLTHFMYESPVFPNGDANGHLVSNA